MTIRFVWDDIAQEIATLEPGAPAWQRTKTHANGVVERRSSRGHLSLEVNAEDVEAANLLFADVSEEYVEQMRGFDP